MDPDRQYWAEHLDPDRQYWAEHLNPDRQYWAEHLDPDRHLIRIARIGIDSYRIVTPGSGSIAIESEHLDPEF